MKAATLILLVACASVVACSAPAASAQPASPSPIASPAGGPPSVRGTVTAGPVCPVERNPPDPKCAPRPVAGAVIVATDAGGQVIGQATSGADGSYELSLSETGNLQIAAQPVTGLMRPPAPVAVTLTQPRQVVQVDLEFDTGIR